MQRADFLSSVFALAAAMPVAAAAPTQWKTVAGIKVPDTALARAATGLASAAQPVEIFNHSLRTYLFAELIAAATNLAHDAELVYVASILHDTGLSPQHMSPSFPFEVDGANVAADLLTKNGVAPERVATAWDAIALHDNSGIAVHKQNEVRLVNAGVGADFGAYSDLITRDQIDAIFAAAPRKDFINVFLDAAAAVARSKPQSTAHSFVADVGYCKVHGFKLPSFCDEVKDDPYAGM
jgi:hypothetical protein